MENTNLNSYQSIPCHKCGRLVNNVGENAIKVTCSYCVLSLVGFPKDSQNKTYKPTGRPAGWHFMSEFVDKDGNVFHKGKEQPKLKGTLPPTKIKPVKKKTKRRTQQQILLDRDKEKKAALKKAAKKQQNFLNHKFGD
jgi:phage FluMu protein Com